MNNKVLKNLKKEYTGNYKIIRRFLFDLFRPIMHDRSTSILNQHTMFYIMFGLFGISVFMLVNEFDKHWLPFVSGWAMIPILWTYFRISPQSWGEMYDYEKDAFKRIWKLPANWEPK